MNKYYEEKIISIHHWTDNLFSFKCTRNNNFKFKNGEFTLVGLKNENNIISRAYSIISSNYEDYLEFFSIKIKNGPLTSKLKNIKINDKIFIGKKSTGTLLTENLFKGLNLWLISTGTGLAPFISIIKDFEIYNNYEKINLIHTTRSTKDLSYRYYIEKILFKNILFKNFKNKFNYYPTVTREFFKNNGRITDLIKNEKLFLNFKKINLNSENDRIMLCGSFNMINDLKNILEEHNFKESKNNELGHYLIERAFVD